LFYSFFFGISAAQLYAVAIIAGTSADPNITGTVTYYQSSSSSNVTVTVNITGMTQNLNALHGIHVHQWGDITDQVAGLNAGSHFNPSNSSHGCPENTSARHYGDMGNWNISNTGSIYQSKTMNLLTLTGSNSIVGLAVIVHKLTDDCVTTLSASSRLAQGVIGIVNTSYANGASNGWSNTVTNAICYLTPTVNSNTTGYVYFQQNSPTGPTSVYSFITGLVLNSTHAFHIHQFGDITLNDGTSTGLHYNPYVTTHGIPPFYPRHVGDMGNIWYYNGNTAYYSYSNGNITLNGANNIIGRGIIIHAAFDDCSSPVGNAGLRLAQCVIGITNQTPNATLFSNVPSTQNDAACLALYGTTNSGNTNATSAGSTSAGSTNAGTTNINTSFGIELIINYALMAFITFFAMVL